MITNISNYKKISIVVLFIFLIGLAIYFLSNNMLFLPKGILIKSEISPNGNHTMNAYKIDGGTLSADSVRVEIITKKKKKNIYWCYPQNEINIKWLNEETVEINGIKLNIKKDKYHKN